MQILFFLKTKNKLEETVARYFQHKFMIANLSHF